MWRERWDEMGQMGTPEGANLYLIFQHVSSRGSFLQIHLWLQKTSPPHLLFFFLAVAVASLQLTSSVLLQKKGGFWPGMWRAYWGRKTNRVRKRDSGVQRIKTEIAIFVLLGNLQRWLFFWKWGIFQHTMHSKRRESWHPATSLFFCRYKCVSEL